MASKIDKDCTQALGDLALSHIMGCGSHAELVIRRAGDETRVILQLITESGDLLGQRNLATTEADDWDVVLLLPFEITVVA